MLQQQATAAFAGAIMVWLRTTFAKDIGQLGPLRLWQANWVFIGGLVVAVWVFGQPLGVAASIFMVWVAATMFRAVAIVSKHRKKLASVFEQIAAPAGLAKGTMAAPANPAAHIKVTRWWRGNPHEYRIQISAAAPAGTPTRRWELERPLRAIPHRYSRSGGDWWFAWPSAAVCQVTALPAGHHLLMQQERHAVIASDLAALFGSDKGKTAVQHGHECTITDWEDHDGEPVIPAGVKFTFGGQDTTDPAFRDRVERGFDQRRKVVGREWLYDWTAPGVLELTLVAGDSTDAKRKLTARWASDQVGQAAGPGKDPVVAVIEMWADDEGMTDPLWDSVPKDPTVPVRMVVSVGTRDVSGYKGRAVTGFCDIAARLFVGLVYVPTVGSSGGATVVVYDAYPAAHTAARRWHVNRWLSDQMSVAAGRGKDPVVTVVDSWADDPAVVDDDAWSSVSHDPAIPLRVSANVGTRDVSGQKGRVITDEFCDNAGRMFPGLTWDAKVGTQAGSTQLLYEGFPATHQRALRIREERRLRAVVDSKFGAKGRGVGAELSITEWLDEDGLSRPARLVVKFGSSVDVTDIKTRDAFVQHFDSTTSTNDWNYHWQPALGIVEVVAVASLPPALPFPNPGTPDFIKFHDLLLQGKVWFGPTKGGGELIWDLSKQPHALVAGLTGSGKSVALINILAGLAYSPDKFRLSVADPKLTDWPWVREFPNVVAYGSSPESIVQVVVDFEKEMVYRQELCKRRGAKNMRDLRRAYEEHPEWLVEDGPCPVRHLLLFDEIMEFMLPTKNEDLQELKYQARELLVRVALLGRAYEMNMIVAAQKPSGDEVKGMGMQLRENLGFRLGMGFMASSTSLQVFDTTHGTRWATGVAPQGRGWGGPRGESYDLVQVFYQGENPERAPWDTEVRIPGLYEVVRGRLGELGYQRIEIPGQDYPSWVRKDRVEI